MQFGTCGRTRMCSLYVKEFDALKSTDTQTRIVIEYLRVYMYIYVYGFYICMSLLSSTLVFAN
jgi:hypothetical protein